MMKFAMLDFDIEATQAPVSAEDCVHGALRGVERWRLDDAESRANRLDEHVRLGSIETEPHMSLEKPVPPALASGFAADLLHQDAAALAV